MGVRGELFLALFILVLSCFIYKPLTIRSEVLTTFIQLFIKDILSTFPGVSRVELTKMNLM